MSAADFSHNPDLIALVAAEIEAVHEDTSGPWPDPTDVIADVLADVRRELRDKANFQAACDQVHLCTAEAIVRNRFADWIEGEL